MRTRFSFVFPLPQSFWSWSPISLTCYGRSLRRSDARSMRTFIPSFLSWRSFLPPPSPRRPFFRRSHLVPEVFQNGLFVLAGRLVPSSHPFPASKTLPWWSYAPVPCKQLFFHLQVLFLLVAARRGTFAFARPRFDIDGIFLFLTGRELGSLQRFRS